jgi:soluble cytochrome b562
MHNKYIWYNFADSRRPTPTDERLERQAQSMGLTGESSPLPTKKENQKAKEPTPKKVGPSGEKSRCQKGKSCGATCIYKGDDCIMGLTGAVATAMPEFVRYIKKYVESGGDEEAVAGALSRMDPETSAAAKKISSALDGLKKKYPDEKERDEKISQVLDLVLPGIAKKGDTGERQAYSEQDINYLRNNKQVEKLEKVYRDIESGKLKTPEEINDALRPLSQEIRVNKISDEQLDLAMAMMPKDLISSLSKQGSPGEWGKWGANQSTLDVPEGGHTAKNASGMERARLIVRLGMEENMRDMYDGRRIGFGDIDLEHGIPFTLAGRGAETGSNFGLSTRLSNRSKGNISPEEWRSKVLKRYPADEKGQLTESARAKLLEEQNSVRKYNNARALASQANPQTVAAVFKGIEDSGMSKEEKESLKNKAMASIAGYTETYFVGERPTRKGASVRVYMYRDSALGSSVLDLAAQKIDKFTQEGKLDEVQKILSILQSGAPRVDKVLDEKFGPGRTSVEAASSSSEAANTVRQELLNELQSI